MSQVAILPHYGKVYRTGTILLILGLIFGLLLTLGLAYTGSVLYITILPVTILGGTLVCFLFANPHVNLIVAILGFVFVASNEKGFQAIEVAYAAYLYTILIIWYLRHFISHSEKILVEKSDWALALFLGLLPATLILTGIFDGDFRVAASELISLSMFLIYFPVKYTVAHQKQGPKKMLVTLVVMSVAVAILNSVNYASDLSNASTLLHIAGSRVVVNDCLLMIGTMMSLTLLIYSKGPASLLLSASALAFTFAGLIMTQSRGFWLAFVFGSLALLLLVRTSERIKILTTATVMAVLIVGIGYILIGPFLTVILEGISERFISIISAFTQDLSLINRFRETSAVFEKIVINPLIGYGPGVSYVFYDIVHQSTDTDSFVHNGYVGLWYKYGIWGTGLVLFFWYSTIKLGLHAFRNNDAEHWTRLAGLAGAVSLIALTVSTLTQNPFFLKNYLFVIAIAAGLAAGAGQRTVQKLDHSSRQHVSQGKH